MKRPVQMTIASAVSLGFTVVSADVAVLALPPADDLPEEVLRTEIITEARSPVDGELLTAAEYAELQAQLADNPNPPTPSPQVENVIRLLRLRQAIRSVFPFLLR